MEYIFDFRTDRYNFWPVYDAIKKYYPIGLSRNEGGIYFEYPGIKNLEEIVVSNIHNGSVYKERWEYLTEKWQEDFKKKIIGTTYGHAPSYSSFIEMKNVECEGRILTEELHYTVSLLGPFYTIFGIDRTTLKDNGSHYPQTHRTIVSPYAAYSQIFTDLRKKIEEAFPGYYFVPYLLHEMFIDGLRVRYRDDEKNRVYHALFNELFEFDSSVVGDPYDYGLDQWFIKNPNMKDDWTIYPPDYCNWKNEKE